MTKFWMLLLLTAALLAAGCSSTPNTGSREYTPGRGWTPTPN